MNPFILKNKKLRLIQISESVKMISTDNSRIKNNFNVFTSSYCIDVQDRTIVYHNEDILNTLFKNLKNSGRDLLLYVLYKIPKDKDVISLKLDLLCQILGTSKPTLISAIKQLIKEEIIAKTENQSNYWVNPEHIFRGNRVDFYEKNYPDYIEIIKR